MTVENRFSIDISSPPWIVVEKEYHSPKDLNTNYVVRFVEYDESFRNIVGEFGGKTGVEFVENAGESSHYDEAPKNAG